MIMYVFMGTNNEFAYSMRTYIQISILSLKYASYTLCTETKKNN